MVQVYLISVSTFDVPTLASQIKVHLGRDPGRALDRANIHSNKAPVPIFLLENLSGNLSVEARRILESAQPSVLDHLHFGFLIVANERTFSRILKATSRGLAFTSDENIGVLSGTLKDWKMIVPACMTENSPSDITNVFEQIFHCFEILGLRDIWSNYSKKSKADGTLLLEYNGR